MKTFKIVVGIILILAAVNTMVAMASEEKGAGLAGAVTGFVILSGIGAWLIYSGVNSKTN